MVRVGGPLRQLQAPHRGVLVERLPAGGGRAAVVLAVLGGDGGGGAQLDDRDVDGQRDVDGGDRQVGERAGGRVVDTYRGRRSGLDHDATGSVPLQLVVAEQDPAAALLADPDRPGGLRREDEHVQLAVPGLQADRLEAGDDRPRLLIRNGQLRLDAGLGEQHQRGDRAGQQGERGRGGPGEANAAGGQVDRPAGQRAGRDVHRAGRELQHLAVEVEPEAGAAVRVERDVRLVPRDEDETAGPVAAQGPSQRFTVLDAVGPYVGKARRHLGEPPAESGQERVLAAQLGVALGERAGLPDRGVEVVTQARQVVRVPGRVRLLHVAAGVGAAGVHVVALPGGPVADLAVRDGGDIERGGPRPAVVRGGHPAGELAGRGRELVGRRARATLLGRLDVLRAPHVGADARVVPDVREEVVVAEVRRPGRVRVDPEAVAVTAVQREDLLLGQLGAVPGGGGPDRRVHAGLAGHALERAQVLRLGVELVLDLDAEHPVEPVTDRGAEGGEPLLDHPQVARVVGTVPDRGLPHPVGEATVAAFGVHPGADPQHDVQARVDDQVDERPDVQVVVETVVTLLRRVVQPEDVAGHDGDAAGLHLSQALRPAVPWDAAVVHLPGDRDDRCAVAGQIPVGQRQTRPDVLVVAHPRPSQGCHPGLVARGEWLRLIGHENPLSVRTVTGHSPVGRNDTQDQVLEGKGLTHARNSSTVTGHRHRPRPSPGVPIKEDQCRKRSPLCWRPLPQRLCS